MGPPKAKGQHHRETAGLMAAVAEVMVAEGMAAEIMGAGIITAMANAAETAESAAVDPALSFLTANVNLAEKTRLQLLL